MPVPSRSSSEAHPSFWRIWLTREQKAFQLGLAVVLLMLVVILSLFTSTFLTTGNILNILRQAAPTLIVAVAMTLVITSGGIDLSVGSSLALASVLAATMLSTGGPWWLVVAVVLVFGCAVGLINGLLVTLISTEKKTTLRLVGTDGHRLAVAEQDLGKAGAKGAPQEIKAIIPKKAAHEMRRRR